MNPDLARERFDRAIAQIDRANSEDPNREIVDGLEESKEIVYAQRMTEWVGKLAPDASEALRLAARSQHIRRWEIPRSNFPMNRAGYHRWRRSLYVFHADTAAEILASADYDSGTIARVREMLQKKNLAKDAEAQIIEDAAALVFLQFHLKDFAERPDIDEKKLLGIVRKTWAKMSAQGHAAAMGLRFSPELQGLVETAIANGNED